MIKKEKLKKIQKENRKEIKKYEKEYSLNATLRDKTYLSFSMLGVTILSFIITKKDEISSDLLAIIYLIICYLTIISILALLSICLCAKVTNKFIDNYKEVNTNLSKISKIIDKKNIRIKSLKKLNSIINNNKYTVLIEFIDKIIFFMLLFLFSCLISLLLYLLFPLIYKLYIEKTFTNIWFLITVCIYITSLILFI